MPARSNYTETIPNDVLIAVARDPDGIQAMCERLVAARREADEAGLAAAAKLAELAEKERAISEKENLISEDLSNIRFERTALEEYQASLNARVAEVAERENAISALLAAAEEKAGAVEDMEKAILAKSAALDKRVAEEQEALARERAADKTRRAMIEQDIAEFKKRVASFRLRVEPND